MIDVESLLQLFLFLLAMFALYISFVSDEP